MSLADSLVSYFEPVLSPLFLLALALVVFLFVFGRNHLTR
jgi:hypothetical protein